jgi:hypothetical protein
MVVEFHDLNQNNHDGPSRIISKTKNAYHNIKNKESLFDKTANVFSGKPFLKFS